MTADDWAPPLIATPPGDDDRPLIAWDGNGFDAPALLDALGPVPAIGPIDVTGRSVPAQLGGLLMAAQSHRPLILFDPAVPVSSLESLPDNAFLVVGTSGSTGRPRAIVRSLASWTRSFAAYSELTGISAGDRVLLTGPLTSTMQLFAAAHAVSVGAMITNHGHQATCAVAVPAVLPSLLGAPSLSTVVLAGSRLPAPSATDAAAAGLCLVEIYGSAEQSFVAGRRWPEPLTPFPGVEIDIVDGVLWSRSEYAALGYDDPAVSPTALLPLRGTGGWVTVGDMCTLTQGQLTIQGRGDAAVTVGGRTVPVEDIEEALVALPGVMAAAAVGVPHPRLGELLAAILVLTEGAALADVRRAAKAALHAEFLPRRWLVVDAIPATANGKIDRAALRDSFSS